MYKPNTSEEITVSQTGVNLSYCLLLQFLKPSNRLTFSIHILIKQRRFFDIVLIVLAKEFIMATIL
ncbi:hypothetical protein [Microcystis aeruginosa]|uniref:Uncharacterized protein n=1 Tax=Microcystis aeruginosa Ma_QC_C_20070703_M131 TaxID=2486263 RepID=A0A551X370_MICAE|nr:hypothetical protein [Microcystis aeruginosa]MDB9393268.1 hypothetical protein [Microcystis aeruginosa CS-579]TRT43217.1 MAG: hypothetical protein EWV85_22480 [Microcystis aeruginosa Ma_QC_C_20070703_M131]